MLNQKFAQITYPKRQGFTGFSIMPWRTWKKNQTVDLMHSIYDFKHYICDSIQSFVKWMTENTLFYCIYGNGLKNCNLRALYCLDVVQIHNQTVLFIPRKDELYQVVLYLFQINVLRHNHLHYHQDHLWYLFQDLDYLTWACALLANSNNCIFTIFIQSDISNVISNALLGTSQSQMVLIMEIFYRLCLQV